MIFDQNKSSSKSGSSDQFVFFGAFRKSFVTSGAIIGQLFGPFEFLYFVSSTRISPIVAIFKAD